MIYATWNLEFSDPQYGTGPEQQLANRGVLAEAGWTDELVENGGNILGYLSDSVNESDFENWNLKVVPESKALEFCKKIDSRATLMDDGKIGIIEK